MEKTRRKSVTMADVAKQANVSVTTVSHVINKTATISSSTIQAVEQAINTTGYKMLASSSLNRGNRIIGVITPDIANEFYSKSIQAICSAAWNHNYAVMVCSMQHDIKAETSHLRSLINSGVSGLIFLGGSATSDYQINAISKKVPVVLGDRHMANFPLDSVSIDNFNIMRKVIGKLARKGYTKIGYLSEDVIMSCSNDRYKGYLQGMKDNNLTVLKNNVFLLPQLRLEKAENTTKYVQKLLSSNIELPEVFLCSSDLVAIGLIRALKNFGYRVPADIGVIGFDDISIASTIEPPLTTIAQNMNQIGKHCFSLLLQRITNTSATPNEITVTAKLIIRDSVRL